MPSRPPQGEPDGIPASLPSPAVFGRKRATELVTQVKESGERAELEPMSPFERKVIHDVVAAAGLESESEGAEPRRYVVVLPPA